MNDAAAPIATLRPDISPSVARVVDAALAFEKDARPADAGTMQAMIQRAYEDRHGASIVSAPKTLVPDTVPDRTLPSKDVGGALVAEPLRLPTTAGPVVSERLEPPSARVIVVTL